jgi:hypothetical protein
VYTRTTSFPVTLEERLRNAIISDYLIGRRLRVEAEADHQRAIAAEQERLVTFRERIGNRRHMYTEAHLDPKPVCFVCGIGKEGHDAWVEGKPYPDGATYVREPGQYEVFLVSQWKIARAMSESTIEVARHMRGVLRQGEW